MTVNRKIPAPKQIKKCANIRLNQYNEMYKKSIEDPDSFWRAQADEHIHFQVKSSNPKISNWNFDTGEINWFNGAKLNVSFNCIDRHLPEKGEQTAIIWEGDDPDRSEKITYNKLHDKVCKLANALSTLGVGKGDRVCLYMPMIPEAIYAMLACTRIGAVHSVVFGGFSPTALADRINDSGCCLVITADEGRRSGKTIPLKANVDIALENCPSVKNVIVCRVTEASINWENSRDVWYDDVIKDELSICEPVLMDAEDPLFILYTSGSTGKPKGVLHSTAGYLLYVASTFKYVFDYKPGEIYWCTADIGWITGHSYLTYGPLANGATTVVYEGVPTFPDPSRFWKIVDKHSVNIFYTAPTAIRALMGMGNRFLETSTRESLRILGTVGEPINPEAWDWYFDNVGNSDCPIVDTWWQTETGGIMITTMPGVAPAKPGCAGLPMFGVNPVILDDKGQEVVGEGTGNLVIASSWPGQMRGVYGNPDRFKDVYFSMYPGYYFTGDGCYRDKDGYIWITGRVDDVINVSGHRLGTAEIESALVAHPAIAEAAVIGVTHHIKGQSIYAYVSPMSGQTVDKELELSLINHVRRQIGPIAKPDKIHWARNLPKTRSGKIMRRILRKIAEDEIDDLGDISTLSDPTVVQHLIDSKSNPLATIT